MGEAVEGLGGRSSVKRLLTGAGPLALAALLVGTSVAPATAGVPQGGSCSGWGDLVTCRADDKTTSPGSGGGGGQRESQPSGGKKGTSKPKKTCTTSRLPDPPAGSSLWEGHDPSEGGVYVRRCLGAGDAEGDTGYSDVFWAGDTPPEETVDPEVLAQEAISKMRLRGPQIRTTPRAGQTGVVGLPTWMWVDPSPTTYGPNTTSASAGGVTVSATAKVSKIVWSMGDGRSVTCTGPGTPYDSSYGKKPSPTCGHLYEQTSAGQPGEKYQVTATATWEIEWQVEGSSEAGEFTQAQQSQAELAVGELQSVGR
ncbi:hypothetical protein SDIAM103S_06009 [Streptomyces diastaticus subsp. diastaticus]